MKQEINQNLTKTLIFVQNTAYGNICSPFPTDLNPLLVSRELIFVRCFIFPEKSHGTTTLYDVESQLTVENGVLFSLFSPSRQHTDTLDWSLQIQSKPSCQENNLCHDGTEKFSSTDYK